MSNIQLKTDPTVNQKINSLITAPITDLDTTQEPLAEPLPKKAGKTAAKIKALMEQDKLTRGETMKLVRLINKQTNEEKKKLPKDAVLEITTNHTTEYADSAFVQNDSVWNTVREVPLSEEETIIYNTRDSLTRIENGDTTINEKRSLIGNLLFFNGSIKNKNKNSILKIPGLLSKLSVNFNTVDGFVLRKKLFFYKRKYKNGKYWEIEPTAFYAFSRETIMGKIDFKSQYNMKKRAHFYFSGGRITNDFNSNKPMPPFFNSIATLFFSENYKKLYQKDYALIGNSFDITNGLNLNISAEYADRKRLFNTTDFTVIKSNNKIYSSNTPNIADSSTSPFIFKSHKTLNLSAILSYTPKQYFRYKNDTKQVFRSKYPTFFLIYKQGVKNVIESQTNYTRIEAAALQVKSINLIDKVGWYIGGGKFLLNNALYFADYKSFNTQPFYFISNSNITSFKLLDFYKYNANNYFFEAHFSIEDNFLLLKNLPLLNGSFLSEGLYANYLYTNKKEHYYELGYGLKNVFLLFDVEAFVSFKNKNYNAFGLKLRFNFINNNNLN